MSAAGLFGIPRISRCRHDKVKQTTCNKMSVEKRQLIHWSTRMIWPRGLRIQLKRCMTRRPLTSATVDLYATAHAYWPEAAATHRWRLYAGSICGRRPTATQHGRRSYWNTAERTPWSHLAVLYQHQKHCIVKWMTCRTRSVWSPVLVLF